MDFKTRLIKLRENVRRKIICPKMRKRLCNTDFSLISSNCTGAIISNELGCRFNTPTVNLYIEPKDFLKFVKSLDVYLKEKLVFDPALSKERGYPVAVLKDIKIYFVHYHSNQDAERKWYERFKRINYSNMFVLMSERDGCTHEDLEEFDQLPFKNKIVLTKRPYPEIKSSVYISGFEKNEQLGDVFRCRKLIGVTKYYDEFNFVGWLNGDIKI